MLKSCQYEAVVAGPHTTTKSAVVAAGRDGVLRELIQGNETHTTQIDNGRVVQLQLSHSDKLLFAGLSSGAIRVYSWPLEADECLETLAVHCGPVSRLCVAHDETHLFTASEDGQLFMVELLGGAPAAALQPPPHLSRGCGARRGARLAARPRASSWDGARPRARCRLSRRLSALPWCARGRGRGAARAHAAQGGGRGAGAGHGARLEGGAARAHRGGGGARAEGQGAADAGRVPDAPQGAVLPRPDQKGQGGGAGDARGRQRAARGRQAHQGGAGARGVRGDAGDGGGAHARRRGAREPVRAQARVRGGALRGAAPGEGGHAVPVRGAALRAAQAGESAPPRPPARRPPSPNPRPNP